MTPALRWQYWYKIKNLCRSKGHVLRFTVGYVYLFATKNRLQNIGYTI